MADTLSITINISADDLAALKYRIIDPEQWIREALAGKVNNCKKIMDQEWRGKLDADPTVTTVPADLDARVKLVQLHPEYEDRLTRDIREAEERRVREIIQLKS